MDVSSRDFVAPQDKSSHRSLAGRDDLRVLTFRQWCELNGLSKDTARRLILRGEGPTILQLSPRRIGITLRANAEWQRSRERA